MARKGENKVVSLLSSLYNSEEDFITEFNMIVCNHLMENIFEYSNEWIDTLKYHFNEVSSQFTSENIIKSLTMINDVQNSINIANDISIVFLTFLFQKNYQIVYLYIYKSY